MRSAALLLALSACSAVQAGPIQFYSGNDLYQRLKSTDFIQKSVALGFIVGVHDTIDGITSCAPSGITVKQVMDITERFLDQYPESRHFPATLLVRNALTRAWPCNKSTL